MRGHYGNLDTLSKYRVLIPIIISSQVVTGVLVSWWFSDTHNIVTEAIMQKNYFLSPNKTDSGKFRCVLYIGLAQMQRAETRLTR